MAVDFTAERATGDLLLSASRGDRAAVDELYRRHKPAGVGYARRRGAEDPEAIYDHVFVDVLAKADYLATERPNAFVAYLNRSIKNRIIQEARRQRPMVTLEGDRIERREAEASFEDLVVGNSWVDEAFAQLTEAQREVMTGRYIEQRSLADVATRLGKSPSAVRQLHQAALRKLRLLLAAGAVLLAVAAAAWIVRELARTSVDTSPIDRVGESEETPTELDGPGDEQGLAPAAVIERSAEGPNRLASADPQGSPANLDPNEADAGGPAGPSTTASSPPPSAPTETTEPGTTPTSLGPPASATPTTNSTPGDSDVPETGSPGTTIGGDDDGYPDDSASTSTSIDLPPGANPPTTATTTPLVPPLAPPAGGLIAHDPFTARGTGTFGFDLDTGWTLRGGQATLTPVPVGLGYTDPRDQSLVTVRGGLRVSDPTRDTVRLVRPLPVVPQSEYGYAISYLLRVDTADVGHVFWTPGGSGDQGGAGIEMPNPAIGLVGGPSSGVTVRAGETNLIVVQIIGDVANLWVNPRLDRPGLPVASHRVDTADPTEAIFGFGAGPAAATIDEFRIGSTVADVLPYSGP